MTQDTATPDVRTEDDQVLAAAEKNRAIAIGLAGAANVARARCDRRDHAPDATAERTAFLDAIDQLDGADRDEAIVDALRAAYEHGYRTAVGHGPS